MNSPRRCPSKRCRYSFIPVLLLLLSPAAASADPVVVTGGSISLYLGDLGGLGFEGDGFSLGVVFGLTAGPQFTRVVPGEPYTPVFEILPSGYGFAHVPGYSTGPDEFVDFSGRLRFVGPTFVPDDPGTLFAFFSSSFSMTGEISGRARGSGPGAAPLFTLQVTGWGTTTAGPFRRFEEDGPVEYINVSGTHSFTFARQDGPDPVPEPATLLLVTSGLAACARVGAPADGIREDLRQRTGRTLGTYV